jgi:alkylation response protein AidB-like acyl-CoA dehydrogenase
MLRQTVAAQELELRLGDPRDPDNPLSFLQALVRDEEERYPSEALTLLDHCQLRDFYIPARYGGALDNIEQLYFLVRVVARRDLVATLAHGITLFASIPIWVAGSDGQRAAVIELIRRGGIAAYCLSERHHGSDLLANDVSALWSATGFSLTGEKWPINSASRGEMLVVFARTDPEGGPRGYSLFLFDKSKCSPLTYRHLPVEPALGLRGLDLSGVEFQEADVSRDQLIGAEGTGLETALKSLQVSRTLCSGLSAGAAQSAMEETLRFARERRLYGGSMLDIPHVRHAVATAFAEMVICDCLSLAGCRALQHIPAEGALWSSVVKYFVPLTTERLIGRLAEVLGARHYLRRPDGHPGVFQKLMRDVAAVSFFDGNTATNLSAIAQTLLARTSRKRRESANTPDVVGTLFAMEGELSEFDFAALEVDPSNGDTLLSVILDDARHHIAAQIDARGGAARELLRAYWTRLRAEAVGIETSIVAGREALGRQWTRSPSSFEVAQQYCVVHAATCCLLMWCINRSGLNAFFYEPDWLVFALDLLLPKEIESWDARYRSCSEGVLRTLLSLSDQRRMYTIVPFRLS